MPIARRRCQMYRGGFQCSRFAVTVIATIPLCEECEARARSLLEEACTHGHSFHDAEPAPPPRRTRPRPAYDANGMRTIACEVCGAPFKAPKKTGRPPRRCPTHAYRKPPASADDSCDAA